MLRYYGGEQVSKGSYWDRRTGEVIHVGPEGGQLPGGADVAYWKMSESIMVVLGPLLGLFYVVFLPLIGFLMLFYHIARFLAQSTRALAYELVGVLSPKFRLSEAYLAQVKRRKKGAAAAAVRPQEKPESRLDALEEEIERRKQQAE